MLKKISLCLLLSLPLLGLAQKNCALFKNGTFKLTDPATKKVCIIIRKDNVQTEKMEDAEEVYDFNIVWIDDCTYTVTPTAATAARNKDTLKAGTITVTITKTKENSYIQRVTSANNPKFRRIDEVFVVEYEDENK
ncbi:hypothetical protein AM493_05340 [Flavobacterium akiainvivens]|uniref:Uncharacterized protein n=1 Tax=Flavobacterium akiainvivens TaxID=1202724 RepID=A0A0M9VHF9_9FLAO|nr:hypothetical protein [Flavobacterium akiainvivens]KOS05519.1 hypothetical protein AM493_05340 [Flavobacterium akiainvivens]SFQ33514.1 hypothetical protein SAMN05444144_103103 [Flavobacterium akiainvivens]